MPTKTVLIADRDLGFVFWIGQRLDRAGYRAFPANSAANAADIVRQFRLVVDLLILNPSIRGIREFAKKLRLAQGHLRTIIVMDEGDGPVSGLPRTAALLRKPRLRDEGSEIEWLETIERVLAEDAARSAGSGAR
jgi:hypothetical protein